jgi:hypothetical protein
MSQSRRDRNSVNRAKAWQNNCHVARIRGRAPKVKFLVDQNPDCAATEIGPIDPHPNFTTEKIGDNLYRVVPK